MPAKPARPLPNSQTAAGTGTGDVAAAADSVPSAASVRLLKMKARDDRALLPPPLDTMKKFEAEPRSAPATPGGSPKVLASLLESITRDEAGSTTEAPAAPVRTLFRATY